ncbi:unnamed protein product [Psylliodes chrysocephalus]|uniref:Uncharacterized protein n=1 Tax=Psylliodes chrysocephalus TaxID=3402493 RepID=A0A9P0CNQ3_9CUCU|nr:unnamed protein product [Psylliodes chrysocephala]
MADSYYQLLFARKAKGCLWPAIKLGKSNFVPDGYRVYYFRNKAIQETTPKNVISDFSILLDEEVSFKYDGRKRGLVENIQTQNLIPYFFIVANKNQLYKVLYNDVYLNRRQAWRILRKYSDESHVADFNDF